MVQYFGLSLTLLSPALALVLVLAELLSLW